MLKGDDNPLINMPDGVKDCILKIIEKQTGAVSVVDGNWNLTGVVTDCESNNAEFL